MSREKLEFMRRAYAAVNTTLETGELGSFLEEFYEPDARYEAVEEQQPLRGYDEIRAYFLRWLEVWDEFHYELEDLIDAGDHVLGVAVLTGRARASGAAVSQRIFQLTELRDMRIARVREYLDRDEAMAAAGLGSFHRFRHR